MTAHGVFRVVGYKIEGPFDEVEAERLLEKALEKGIIHQFDTGRGDLMWFNGPPGREMRALRKSLKALKKKA